MVAEDRKIIGKKESDHVSLLWLLLQLPLALVSSIALLSLLDHAAALSGTPEDIVNIWRKYAHLILDRLSSLEFLDSFNPYLPDYLKGTNILFRKDFYSLGVVLGFAHIVTMLHCEKSLKTFNFIKCVFSLVALIAILVFWPVVFVLMYWHGLKIIKQGIYKQDKRKSLENIAAKLHNISDDQWNKAKTWEDIYEILGKHVYEDTSKIDSNYILVRIMMRFIFVLLVVVIMFLILALL